ncbi:MAG: O-antigen ligase family protein [Candidatus Levyibacteriota bacterium]
MAIIFLILLFIFPLGEITRLQFSNGIAFTLNDIFIALTVTVWFIWRLIKRKELKIPLLKPIMIFAGFGLFSLIINILNLNSFQFLVSFLYLFRWLIYAGIYFVVFDFDPKFKRKIPVFMIIVGMIVVLIGFVQYFLYPSLRNLYYLGWDEHLYRMFSSFLDPNFLGVFFVLLFLLVFEFFFRTKERQKKILMAVLSILILVSIYLTFSRSAYAALVIGLTVFLVLENKRKWSLAMFGIIILVLILSLRNSNIENQNLFRTASSIARIDSSLNAIKIIEKNPIFGVGFNAYRYAQIRYGFRGDQSLFSDHAGSGTDNSFLFILATTGILGLSGYLYLTFSIFKNSLKLKSTLLVSSLTSLIIASFFINALFYPFLMQWVWILVGLTENK